MVGTFNVRPAANALFPARGRRQRVFISGACWARRQHARDCAQPENSGRKPAGGDHDRRKAEALRLGPRRRRHDARPSRPSCSAATARNSPATSSRPSRCRGWRISACARRASRRRPRSPPSARSDHYDRAAHTYGKSYPDYVRALLGDYDCAPDVVAYPRNEAEVAAVIDWAGGVERLADAVRRRLERLRRRRAARRRRRYKAAVTLDLRHLGKVRRGRPDLARRADRGRRLRPRAGERSSGRMALTLRHFPQSFEYSTLGGWIATRSGGHFATLYTHIDDFVESLRMVTPRGMLETRRLPGSGAGPSPDRMLIGSEGIARRHHRGPGCGCRTAPRFRAGASVRFKDFFAAARAVRADRAGRALSVELPHPRSARGLQHRRRRRHASPSWCWLSNPPTMPPDAWMARALECCADHGGTPEAANGADAHREGAAGIWRNAFIRMPYARERLTPARHHQRHLRDRDHLGPLRRLPRRGQGGDRNARSGRRPAVKGEVTCRFTHVYPDGPAPYFTFHALGRHGALLDAVAGDQERGARRA